MPKKLTFRAQIPSSGPLLSTGAMGPITVTLIRILAYFGIFSSILPSRGNPKGVVTWNYPSDTAMNAVIQNLLSRDNSPKILADR